MTDYFLFFLFTGFFLLQLILVVVFGEIFKKGTKVLGDKIASISVVIPFRNEIERIKPLIRSLNNLELWDEHAIEFIFVDDWSEDGGVDQIAQNLNKPYKMLYADGKGKKQAIRQGVLAAEKEFILTWDADIEFENNYFEKVLLLAQADMWILPVRMTGNSLLGKLASIDFSWLQILTVVAAKKFSPILNNGANLLFKKATFLELDEQRDDYDKASGDDMFLLQAMRESKNNIQVSSDKHLQVRTPAPDGLKALLAQRIRWTGKMGNLQNSTSRMLTVVLTLSVFFLFASIFNLALSGNLIFLIPIGLKYLSEYIILRYHKGLNEAVIDIPLVLIHQLLFPVYLIAVLTIRNINEPRWSRIG